MSLTSIKVTSAIDATVTSKGQITLPSELRQRLGLRKGSKIRFTIPSTGPVEIAPIRYRIKDLWRMADEDAKPAGILSFGAMNAAKVRRPS